MHIGGYCPGCGGGEGNQSCAIARCGMEHGVEFCCFCAAYPCAQYEKMHAYDVFISHRNQRADLDRLQCIGLAAYKAELDERICILKILLEKYNDGRRKTLFCMAANLLEVSRLRQVMTQMTEETRQEMPRKEKAALAALKLQAEAEKQGVSLKLRKKP